jgi:hypothetical protein
MTTQAHLHQLSHTLARIAQLESEKAALGAALRATQRHFDEAMSEGVDADAICAIRELVQDALAAAGEQS